MKRKFCMLEENKICDDCLECNTCDLDPNKICDNCAKCIDSQSEYRAIEIDDFIISEDLKRKFKIIERINSKTKEFP
ncbi:MAG: hypothetical protein CVU89_16615 [Firmicutes bacterium HGW-Firmicutes-14]|nr:MAG: hypothetical protein CVU89_16615 [Firmicutes bacterium HGW-Firmicutes-14]